MNEAETKVLKDLKAFIDFGIKHNRPYEWILANIGMT